jgi:hypothetical protein
MPGGPIGRRMVNLRGCYQGWVAAAQRCQSHLATGAVDSQHALSKGNLDPVHFKGRNRRADQGQAKRSWNRARNVCGKREGRANLLQPRRAEKLCFLNVGAQWDTFRPSPGFAEGRCLEVRPEVGDDPGESSRGLPGVLSGSYRGLIGDLSGTYRWLIRGS